MTGLLLYISASSSASQVNPTNDSEITMMMRKLREFSWNGDGSIIVTQIHRKSRLAPYNYIFRSSTSIIAITP